jgi:hypothetical protein
VDPLNRWLVLKALAAATVLPALVLVWNRRPGGWRPWPASAVLGAGAGFYAGAYLLGFRPHWPPAEDRDRLLLLLLPTVIAIEVLAGLVPWRWVGQVLRLCVAGSAACILLHGSVYLTQPPGPDSMGWTPRQQWLILSTLGAALVFVWTALNLLAVRAPGRALPLALAFSCAAAAAVVMLSGYATAAPIGLLLAASIFGATVGSLFLSTPFEPGGLIGLGIVGLFSLVITGRFFVELTTCNAILLFAAPLMCWVPELPYLNRLRPGLRGAIRPVLTAVLLAVALGLILRGEKRATPAVGNEEPGVEDYRNFGN